MINRLGPNDRIPLEKRSNEVAKQVDLVIYKSGERIVIGRVVVNPDGSFAGQIAKDFRKEVKDLFKDGIGDISFNPPHRVNYTTYSNTKTSEVHEVAVVPPLKVQEINDGPS